MKSLLLPIVAILLAQFLPTKATFNLPEEINGKPVNKELHTFITQLADVSQEIYHALRWKVEIELGILEELAEEGDLAEYETAIQQIKAASQRILDGTLEEIKYKDEVDFNSFIRAIKEYKNKWTIQDPKMAKLAQMIFNHRKAQFRASRKRHSS